MFHDAYPVVKPQSTVGREPEFAYAIRPPPQGGFR